MEDQRCSIGDSEAVVSCAADASETKVKLMIKTLDSKSYTFYVDKNIPVLSFKEKIANEIGLPADIQRLIFKGKVLKNENRLSEYHVEDGDALHLVGSQPAPSGPQAGSSSNEANGANVNPENNSAGGVPRNRVGQISHSVLLGTFNVGEEGGGMVPDIGRVIGTVLNSIGIGGHAFVSNNGAQPDLLQNNTSSGADGQQDSSSNQNAPGEVAPLPFAQVQIGRLATPPSPFVYQQIPHSLSTISEYMSWMDAAFTNAGTTAGYRPGMNPRVPLDALPDIRSLPSPASVTTVLNRLQAMLNDHVTRLLSLASVRLAQVANTSVDIPFRSETQNTSMESALMMHHLGVLFLELARVMQTVHIGQVPSEFLVNAGPAVYLTSSGPNPIMVQPSATPLIPLPLDSSSGFPAINQAASGMRHVNIHIHAGTARSGGRAPGSGEPAGGQPPQAPEVVVSVGTDDGHPPLPAPPPQESSNPAAVGPTPLGLGSAGLQRRSRPPQGRPVADAVGGGQDILRALASQGQQQQGGGGDFGRMMTDVLRSPAIEGLLSAVSQQSGVGSPDTLRNVIQQVTQNPHVQNAVTQIADQVRGSSPTDAATPQGIDFSRMLRQMLPVVSHALVGQQSPSSGGEAIGRTLDGNEDPDSIFQQLVQRALLDSSDNECDDDVVQLMCTFASSLGSEYGRLLGHDSRNLLNASSSNSNP